MVIVGGWFRAQRMEGIRYNTLPSSRYKLVFEIDVNSNLKKKCFVVVTVIERVLLAPLLSQLQLLLIVHLL